jgi:hypothetical protein
MAGIGDGVYSLGYSVILLSQKRTKGGKKRKIVLFLLSYYCTQSEYIVTFTKVLKIYHR